MAKPVQQTSRPLAYHPENDQKAIQEARSAQASIPALELARTPRLTRRLAVYVILFLIVLIPALLFVPWTQTVYGSGRAIAFNPVQRPQFLVSPIEGRVKKWYVYEGDSVVAGQLIAELVDNDPRRLERLEDQELLAIQRVQQAEGRILDLESRLALVAAEREPILADADARVQVNEQQVLVAMQELERAEADKVREQFNFDRNERLFNNAAGNVVSRADVEEAKRRLDLALAQVPLVKARIKLAERMVDSAKAFRASQDKRTNATIKTEDAALRSARGDLASVQQQLNTTKIELERQRNQYIKAPVDGKIFRLLANAEAGGLLVRPGERLAILAPDIKPWQGIPIEKTPAVQAFGGVAAHTAYQSLTPGEHPGTVAELNIDGNDLPLVRKGDRVLLQFEGFPAVQFAGIPDVAMGVFEGKIYLVDPTADEKTAQFRLLVEPVTTMPDGEMINGRLVAPWPEERFIRQGLRVQGWVLLREVKLGWELWRLLNGFPPARDLKTKDNNAGILGPVAGGKK